MASSKIKDSVYKASQSHMPEIPEEAIGPDGRPLSMRPQSVASPPQEKRNSVTSNVSEATTRVDVGPSKALPFEVLRDVKVPTDFGPHNEYKAVPSVIEYKTSRGRPRVSVREATHEEAEESSGHVVPLITDIPELAGVATPSDDLLGKRQQPQPYSNPPAPQSTLTDPTIRVIASNPPVARPRESVADSVRTSTTEIRMSTASTQSDSSTAADDDQIAELRSNASTLLPHQSPQDRIAALSQKPSMSSVAHSLPHYTSKSSMRSHGYQPSVSVSEKSGASSVPITLPGNSFEASRSDSRFSWHVSKTEKTSNWFTRWFVDWWALEILSWFVSLACMMIIVAFLLHADGRPLPEWELGVSVNAFISIFSGFAKSALLLPTAEALGQLKWSWFTQKRQMIDFEVMDSASRGPIGSLMFLMRSKGITLASVGAAIILLSLPLDLFFQQIVDYPEPYLQNKGVDPPVISRSIWYDPDADSQWRGDREILTNDFQIESILNPYWTKLDQYPRAVLQQQCPTSNCTFELYHTLALDFNCMELPIDTLAFGCQTTSGEWLSTVAYEGPYLSPNISSCGWYLDVPGYMPQLMSGYETRNDGSTGEVLATRVFPLTDVVSKREYYNGGSISFPDVNNPVVDFVLVSTPEGFDGALRNSTPAIHECEIHWVVKQIRSIIQHGVPWDNQTDTLQFENLVDSPWDLNDANVYQANFSMTLPDVHALEGNSSTYGLSNETARKVWQSWAEFAPSAFVRPAVDGPVKSDQVFKVSWLSAGDPVNSVVSSDMLPWDTPRNVTDHMSQAVLAMNIVMRNNVLSGSNRRDAAYGKAYWYITVVDVRWVWISLPAALLGFAGLFLLATILRARKEPSIGVWKTSALAVLFNGPGEDVQEFVGEGPQKRGYVRRKARDMEVQLGDD